MDSAQKLFSRRKVYNMVAVIGLLLSFWLMTSSALQKSATVDEQSHLFRGAAYLKTGATHFLLGHPLLSSTIFASPLLTESDLQLPQDDPAWVAGNWSVAGDRFLWGINDSPRRLLFLGRLAVIWMTLLMGTVAFRWARRLAGRIAGLLVMGALLFDPNVLAHGRIIGGDAPLTFFFLLTLYAYWEWVRGDFQINGRRVGWLILSGLAFGAAGATKFNGALLVPILILISGYIAIKVRSWQPLVALLIIGTVGWMLIWAVYGFHFWHGVLPGGAFWDDLFWVLQYFGKPHGAYLMGESSQNGWWYYFPAAFLLKTPLPTLFLLAFAFGLSAYLFLRHRRPLLTGRWAYSFLLLPPIMYLVISINSSLNIGYRHLLPMLPFLYIFGIVAVWGKGQAVVSRIAPVVTLLLILISLISWPNYLPYFNQLAGGDGWTLLSDSNVDWGQDLPALAAWQEARGGESLYLSYFGTAHPSAYGVDAVPIPSWSVAPEQGDPARQVYNPADPAPGWYAISVTNLHGVVLGEQRDAYAAFREREPVEKLGGSIFLYAVEARGETAVVTFSAIKPASLDPSLHEQLQTNDVQPRWFAARESMFWPANGGWMAVRADETASSPELAALQPDTPIAETNGQRLYALPSPPPLEWATSEVPFGDGLTFLGEKTAVSNAGEVALLTAWRVEMDGEKRPLKLFVHAVNANDEIVGQWDGLSVAPDAWMSGDVFVQSHRFTVNEENYRLAIGVYDAESGERLAERYFLE